MYTLIKAFLDIFRIYICLYIYIYAVDIYNEYIYLFLYKPYLSILHQWFDA